MGRPRTRPNRRRTSAGVSLETLKQAPGRVLEFLLGVSADAGVRRALAPHGFGVAQREEGLALLSKLALLDRMAELDVDIVAAVDAVRAWVKRSFPVIRAALAAFPQVHDEVFRGAEATGTDWDVEAAFRVASRIEALAASTDATERAAATKLAERGFGPEVVTRVKAMVEASRTFPETTSGVPEEEIEAALVALRSYHDEWSAIARVAVTSRASLARLGLAGR